MVRCDDRDPTVQVRCPFAPGTSGAMPVEALSRLPECSAIISVYTESRTIAMPGGLAVRIAARARIFAAAAQVF